MSPKSGASAMNRERLQKIRNYQSDDWYPALVMRPITIAVMLLVADWRFLTPNRLTTLGNLCKAAAAALIVARADAPATIAAVVLLQLGLLFDHLDGTMARYRRAFTRLGSFYDKVSDLVTWFAISMALGWRAYLATGRAGYLVLAAGAAFALDAMGYMKWLHAAEGERLRWLEAREDPAAAVAQRTAPIQVAGPPARSRRDWLVWLARMLPQVVRFEETDLFFWIGLGLLIGRPDLLLWLLCATQMTVFVSMAIRRGRDLARIDRRMRELGD